MSVPPLSVRVICLTANPVRTGHLMVAAVSELASLRAQVLVLLVAGMAGLRVTRETRGLYVICDGEFTLYRLGPRRHPGRAGEGTGRLGHLYAAAAARGPGCRRP